MGDVTLAGWRAGAQLRDHHDAPNELCAELTVKTKPVVVHSLTSAIQMSAWRHYTRSATLP
jgi:acetolactate synthase I/II/III large subunit